MSILDAITGSAERHPEMNQQQHAGLIEAAMQMFGNHAGISGLLKNANAQGLGHIVQSWIGTAGNQPIAPGQLEGVLGQDRINQLASRAGIPPAIANAALSRVLPVVVDRLTPHGKLPEAA